MRVPARCQCSGCCGSELHTARGCRVAQGQHIARRVGHLDRALAAALVPPDQPAQWQQQPPVELRRVPGWGMLCGYCAQGVTL